MRRFSKVFAFLSSLVVLASAGCGDEQPPVDRLGVNIVDKSVFEGSWYMSSVVLDVDYEAAGLGTFPGDAASDNVGSFGALPRIRWVVDENFLYAYRDYELTIGGEGEPIEPGDVLGQPVAAYRIEKHFDIKREYNTTTGEEINLLVENDSDRRWYERQFMRVDWSKNLLTRYFGQTQDLYEIFGLWVREPADIYVQQQSNFPDSWRPRFHQMQCNGATDTSAGCTEAERDLASDFDTGEIYAFDFVTQDLLSPGTVPDPFTGAPTNWCVSVYSDAPICSTMAVYLRTSFMKVSPKRQYQPTNWVDSRQERFGYFRNTQSTYDRMTAADDPYFGYTDFLNYAINRHNMWMQWTRTDGTAIPYSERQVRPIVFYITSEMPAHLVKPTFDFMSEWNATLMTTVRSLRGQANPTYPTMECQTARPDDYCFCQADSDGTILNPTCPGKYDPFESPAQAMARGVTNPFDCHVEVPAGAEPNMDDVAVASRLTDESFYGWFDAKLVGSECVAVVRNNTCNRKSIAANGGSVDGLECQERGDMRFKFVSYVDQPGTGFLGITTFRANPVTGEIVAGDANIGGPALDGYRTRALQVYDLVNGNVTEQEFYTGEDVRAYVETLNNVVQPATPRIDFTTALRQNAAAVPPRELEALHERMGDFMHRAEQLRGPDGRARVFSDRRQRLVGSEFERRLLSNYDTLAMAGITNLPTGTGPGQINEAILNQVSPFRNNVHEQLRKFDERETRIASRNLHLPTEYVDHSVMHFATKHADWPRARFEFELNRLLYRETQAHEMGHTLGLRHDFGASADTGNYHDGYYEINERYPLPDPADYDRDGVPGLNPNEGELFERDYAEARRLRELAGIDGWMNSSLMEYTANWYERVQPAGRYDNAAIMMGYGDIIEVHDNSADLDPSEINPLNTPRVLFKHYEGGEACETDADCPYSAGGSHAAELLATNRENGVTQRCITNPRVSTLKMCSSFRDDLTPKAPRWLPVDYRFCTDERATGLSTSVGTLGWCNRYDEGDSYREIVQNISESYDRMYLFTNFRRYRRGFDISNYVFDEVIGRRFIILQNLYQHLLFNYSSDPAFRSNPGAFGFVDSFFATADVLNFYAKVLASPNVGAYRWDPNWERYRRSNVDPNAPGAELRVPVGLGRYSDSVYQAGLTGIERIERIGTFYDKLFAMDLMTQRGIASSYTRDLPFFTNFYDLFPNEMQQIFGGMIRNVPEEYMPRVDCASGTFPRCNNPRVVYMDFYRGDCTTPDSDTCRPDPAAVTYRDLPVLDGGQQFLLQFQAAINGLIDFPVFYDTTFQNQLFVCVEGQGDCHDPDDTSVEGVDYVRYTSRRYTKSFLAWQVEPRVGVAEQLSLGFAMVQEAKDSDFILDALLDYRGDFGGEPFSLANLSTEQRDELDRLDYEISTNDTTVNLEINRLYGRVADLESFFNQLIQFQRQLGIASYL